MFIVAGVAEQRQVYPSTPSPHLLDDTTTFDRHAACDMTVY